MRQNKNSIKHTELIKIGILAKKANLLPSAIRYYTRIGLLTADGYTKGRHRLYRQNESLKKLELIKMATGKTNEGQKETLLKLKEGR